MLGPPSPRCALGLLIAALAIYPGCRSEPVAEPAPHTTAPAPLPGQVKWIGLGGGPYPDQNQVSIEQDLAAAARAFGPDGLMLFAGGPGNRAVQVEQPGPHTASSLRARLGSFFSPRAGRGNIYRATELAVHFPATGEGLQSALQHASGSSESLLMYIAGHGDLGESPAQNALLLWGNEPLSVEDFARTLEELHLSRPLQIVSTTCFSGGLAELVFAGAQASRGATPYHRCGLFAAPSDLPAAGCDPNPDRREQEGYGVYFFAALTGIDARGRAIPPAQTDLNGDGSVSLLEAHTYVRIHSTSTDVPTTTSERWLAHAAPARGPLVPVALPEEQAVITALSRQTGLPPELPPARAALDALEKEIELLERDKERHLQAEEEAYFKAAAALLHRWPVLDDPWHPLFERTLTQHGPAIEQHLNESLPQRTYRNARGRTHQAEREYWQLRHRAAPIERLVRALEQRERAGRLAAQGGEPWEVYQRLLACERSLPPSAAPAQGSGSAQHLQPVE